MNNIFLLSNAQLDIEIAKIRGWRVFEELRGNELVHLIYRPEYGDPWSHTHISYREEAKKRYREISFNELDDRRWINKDMLPKCSTDITDAWELVKELAVLNAKLVLFESQNHYQNYYAYFGEGHLLGFEEWKIMGETAAQAISRAYLYFRNKEEYYIESWI